MVMEKLKGLDYIAYIRFASVYREFADIEALKEAVDNLVVTPRDRIHPGQLPLIPGEALLKEKSVVDCRDKGKQFS